MVTPYDVIIIGGSYAGLSAAMSLGRARRRVLIIDAGAPCNRQTPHAHNLITHDGDRPGDIMQLSVEQVLTYPTVTLVHDKAVNAGGTDGAFTIRTESGASFEGTKLLLATGVKDIPMPIDGFAECWGISVLHCPYCHGYEVADQPLAVIANGEMAFEFARLIHQWTKQLTLLTNGTAALQPEQRAALEAKGIAIIEKPIAALKHVDGLLKAVQFEDGSSLPLTAVFARGGLEQQGTIVADLGCTLGEDGMVKGLIKTEIFGKTTVPGVYAAGDNCTPMRSLAAAIAGGSMVGAVMNHEMIAERF